MRLLGTIRPGLADAVTIGNALCGSAAIVVVIAAPWGEDFAGVPDALRLATLLILSGMVFDVFDGAVARARGGTRLGPYLDSLADAVTFGVAPAVVVGGLAIRQATALEAVAVGIGAMVYVMGALVRLADFDAGRADDPHFTGAPSPAAAGVALAIGFLAPMPWLAAVGLAAVGWLMVSPVRYPRSRAVAFTAAALGLATGVAVMLDIVDVRIPAALVIALTVVIVPVTHGVMLRVHARRIGGSRAPGSGIPASGTAGPDFAGPEVDG